MGATTVAVRRVRRAGRRSELVRFPAGWEVRQIAAAPAVAPLAPESLPAARSLPVSRGPLLVVVNDAQRATPTPWLLERLDCDWDSPQLRLAVASGCHAPPTESELRRIFGGLLERVRRRIHVHRAATDRLVRIGVTSRGTPVEINSIVDAVDAIVCLGSVEPHYFAGWTGGRKSLVPGLCSLETMRANHALALAPGSAIGALEANPLHLDLVEAAALVHARLAARGTPEPLGVNVLATAEGIHGWHAGPLLGTVEALAPRGWELFGRRVAGPYPLVLCFVDHPLERDLYQALKAFEHWKTTVAPGGILAIIADCPDGIGPPAFTQFLGAAATHGPPEKRRGAGYRLGDHKLLSFLGFKESGRQVWLVSAALTGRADLPLPVFGSIRSATRAAGAALGAVDPQVLVVEDAATIVPLPGGAPPP